MFILPAVNLFVAPPSVEIPIVSKPRAVVIPANTACPFESIVAPVPTVIVPPIDTLSGRPMTTLFVPVEVSISFAVPSISNTSVAQLILSFDPESADTARLEEGEAPPSTYALIDC